MEKHCENCVEFPKRKIWNKQHSISQHCYAIDRALIFKKGKYLPCQLWNERDIEEEIVSNKTW